MKPKNGTGDRYRRLYGLREMDSDFVELSEELCGEIFIKGI